jgi:ABC-2 type transport system permease protein
MTISTTKNGATAVERAPGKRIDRTLKENSLLHFFPQTWIQVQRLLLRWLRDPLTVIQSLVFPALLLIILNMVLGTQIQTFANLFKLCEGKTEHCALYGTVPMTALAGIMAGSTAGAITLGREGAAGLLARFWVLPVHRASGLVSRILAELVRITIGTIVIVIVGYVLGFRFEQGFPAAVLFVGVTLIFGLGFATLVTSIAVFSAKATLVEGVSLLSSLLMFFSTGFVLLPAFPEWIKPLVQHQPLTCAIDTMRALSLGGPLQGPLIGTLLWSLGAVVVFGIPAVIGFSRASRR